MKSRSSVTFAASEDSISRAAEIISKGGIVAFPTETVYGLGADALNPLAAAKIFEAKNRPLFDPLIVHVAEKDISRYCFVNKTARLLIENFWPGPLTLVLRKKKIIPDIITAGLPNVAIRMPSHSVAGKLIKSAGTPVAAPSANPFGYISPTTAAHVGKQLGKKVDMILDGGKCKVGVESTIISIIKGKAELLRPGGITVDAIEKIIGKGKVKIAPASLKTKPDAPGQLPEHYSPATPMVFYSEKEFKKYKGKKTGMLAFSKLPENLKFTSAFILSQNRNMREAAANLFLYMHELDNKKLDVIFVEQVPEQGLGLAIMDRLNRAVKKYQ